MRSSGTVTTAYEVGVEAYVGRVRKKCGQAESLGMEGGGEELEKAYPHGQ